jgi:hypothetical protein
MQTSPYDENWNLDMDTVELLAVEMQLNHPLSIVATAKTTTCGGCGAVLKSERVDGKGRNILDFACGHRYTVGLRTVSIERV